MEQKKDKTLYVSATDGTAMPANELASYTNFVKTKNEVKDDLIEYLERVLEHSNKNIENLETKESEECNSKTIAQDIVTLCPNDGFLPATKYIQDFISAIESVDMI